MSARLDTPLPSDPTRRAMANVVADLVDENRQLRRALADVQARCTELVAARRATLRSQVREFHATFGVPRPERPAVPGDDRVRLRLRLVAEEFVELLQSCLDGDGEGAARTAGVSSVVGLRATDGEVIELVESVLRKLIDRATVKVSLVDAADALGDIAFVVEGSFQELGIDSGPVLDEIARSNLTKWPTTIDANGKVTKGPQYEPPRLDEVLRAQGGRL